jgi:Tol biopolymer transport system component
MAERSYARLSRLLNHQFREKKPLILFRSRGDFAQNNVTGDLGEGTGGVTEAHRHRNLLPFTGDYKSFEHVLAHEMVHEFQYDIFARGRAGNGLQTLSQVQPPLWFMEGMAEYLSLGPNHILTQAWVRDASLNGNLPTIEQMTNRPDVFFPYRYGEALWEYVGKRWGDEVIGEILNSAPNVGIERSFKREIGLSLEDLSDEWREAMQVKHLPQVAELDRARKFSEALLNRRKTGGFAQLFVAPALSSDGKYIAFIAQGSFFRGEVFPDLWLGDGETGKRVKRLVKSTTSADFEELRLIYSQSSFSPDGKQLAFTAQRDGKDVLYLLNLRTRKTTRRVDLPLEWVTSPSWSPDGKQIVVSGSASGLTDLYIIDLATGQSRRLTNDKYAELQPQWSPDGKTIAFATDRGEGTDLDLLRFNPWRIATYDLGTARIDVLPGQDGLNLNPQWAPDGKSLAFISDRTGIANIFLYDLESKQHYQLTNVIGSVGAFTEYSPAITWAHQADRLAFTYYENGDYTVWSVNNPRKLKQEPFKPKPRVVDPIVAQQSLTRDSTARVAQQARAADMLAAIEKATKTADSTRDSSRTSSLYRAASGIRLSADVPTSAERTGNAPVSVAALLDSADLALPDTTKFRAYDYSVSYQPEAIYRPSVGYAQDNFQRGLYGGAGIILADMLGNNRVTLAGQVNGRFSEAFFLGAYTSLASRFQYTLGLSQTPYFLPLGYGEVPFGDGTPRAIQSFAIARFIQRDGFAIGIRPFNRFTRVETGLNVTNMSRTIQYISRGVDYGSGYATDYQTDSVQSLPGFNFVGPHVAYVTDNTLFGYTGPISGKRYRFQIQPNFGGLQWTEFSGDYRKYVPVLFNFITLAYRAQTSISVGKDESFFPKYLGRADFVRGYDRNQYLSSLCGGITGATSSCSATELLGSRVALANVEVRFPLIRRLDVGVVPISLPPLDGLFFFDAGIAWSKGQTPYLSRPDNYDQSLQRYLMRSYGAGLRLNLFGFALLRWDYAIALDRTPRKGYWLFTLGQSF